MRKIIILRGPQGSGKSTLVRRLGLEGHALSYDAVRQVLCGDALNARGVISVSQEHNQLAFAVARESLDRRMSTGETILFEATLPKTRDVDALVQQARAHRYDVLVADFFMTDPTACAAANAARPERLHVPAHAVARCFAEAEGQADPAGVRVVRYGEGLDVAAADADILAFLSDGFGVIDADRYRRVVHVGDLQGVLSPLFAEGSPLSGGLRDEDLHVFHGDLFDRGPRNGEVARWWLDHAAGRPNVLLIAGNHETHVDLEAAGLPAVSREFSRRTLPQLEAAGVTRDDLRAISASLLPMVRYVRKGVRVVATHAGLARPVERPWLLSEAALRKGGGFFDTEIDAAWSVSQEAMPEADRAFGVHGHRNSAMLPTRAAAYAFNLEGQVEFGGHLRMAVLDDTGWTTVDIRNDADRRTMQEAHILDLAEGRRGFTRDAPIAPWASEGRIAPRPFAQTTLDAFTRHALVAERMSDSMPHVKAINFTRTAFHTKAWDAVNSHARGLFVDDVDGTCVARGWEKFFNRGERPETSDIHLEHAIVWPVDGYGKSNGFLGLTGYSERSGELVIASKSRVEGPFADMFRRILTDGIGTAGLERLLRFNRDQVAACLFEVNDPVNDPHMIEYDEPHVVLLACVHRDETFRQMPYGDLVKLAAHLGCPVKERVFGGVRNWRALSAMMDRVEKNPEWRAADPLEGIVFEDAAGVFWKVKANRYAHWKTLRGAKERMLLARRKDVAFDMERYGDDAEKTAFLTWAATLTDAALEMDIIALRKLYQGDPASAAALTAPAPKAKGRDVSGYVRGLDAMAAAIAAGTAKPESIARLVALAGDGDDRRAAFDGHPARDALLAAAEGA